MIYSWIYNNTLFYPTIRVLSLVSTFIQTSDSMSHTKNENAKFYSEIYSYTQPPFLRITIDITKNTTSQTLTNTQTILSISILTRGSRFASPRTGPMIRPTLSGYHLSPLSSMRDSRDKFMSAMSSRAASRSKPCKCKEGLLAMRTSRVQHFISAATTG